MPTDPLEQVVERLNKDAAWFDDGDPSAALVGAGQCRRVGKLLRQAAALLTSMAQELAEAKAERDEAREIAKKVPGLELDIKAAQLAAEVTEDMLSAIRKRAKAAEAKLSEAVEGLEEIAATRSPKHDTRASAIARSTLSSIRAPASEDGSGA